MIITVRDIFDKVEQINRLIDIHDDEKLNNSHFDDLIELISDYKDELMNKKVSK